jgi:hypothetical protein
MNDPVRLKDLPDGGLSAELLAVGKAEAPSQAASQAVLGLVNSATLGAGSAGSSLALAGAVGKWLGLIALAGGIGTGLWRVGAAPPPPTALERGVVPAKVVQHAARPDPIATIAVDELPLEPAKAVQTPTRASAASDETPPAPSLSDELRHMDSVRRALASGNPSLGLERIAEYREDFPRGRFHQEATVLRIQALVQSGQSGQARSEAERFISAHPKSAAAKRVRTLVGLPDAGR